MAEEWVDTLICDQLTQASMSSSPSIVLNNTDGYSRDIGSVRLGNVWRLRINLHPYNIKGEDGKTAFSIHLISLLENILTEHATMDRNHLVALH